MTNPTPSLKEEIEKISKNIHQTILDYGRSCVRGEIVIPPDVSDINKVITNAFTQAIERAEPEYMKPCDKPSCKSCSYLRGQQDAKSDYKQRLLAEVK